MLRLPNQQLEKKSDRRGAALVLGFGGGAAMFTVDHALLGPRLSGAVWLLLWVPAVYGLSSLTLAVWVRRGMALMLLVLAFNLWQSFAPHAKLEIAGFGFDSGKPAGPNQRLVFFGYINNGKWTAYMANGRRNFAFVDVGAGVDAIEKYRPTEITMHERMEKAADGQFVKEFGTGDPSKMVIPVNLDDKQKMLFEDRKLALLVLAQVRYRDWWKPKTRVVEVCRYLFVDGATANCNRFNSDRWTTR
jgi:hypothetical protein